MSEEKAPFNSAIDTLERLADIMRKRTRVLEIPGISDAIKQGVTLELTKEYFRQAIPLLSKEGRGELRGVLKLKQDIMNITDNQGNVKRKEKKYSENLDDNLDNYLINIQIDLQDKGGYFMPPRKDPSKIVGQM